MVSIEHFTFIPVIALVAIILIVLSVRLLFRLLVLFFVLLVSWYLISCTGLIPSPQEVLKQPLLPKKTTFEAVVSLR